MSKILVVDDNEQNLYMMKILLEGNGYELETAKDGTQALEIARKNAPDVIISDILMPGMDGFALCREWKKDNQLKNIPFIFYTATYTESEDEEFALSLGAERFLRKPTEPEKFIEILHEVLEKYRKGELIAPQKPIEEEKVYFQQYNRALIRKLEDKMLELKQANKRLSALFQTSVGLTSLQSLEELIEYVLKKVLEMTNCTQGIYFKFDENKKEFHIHATVGFKKQDINKLEKELIFHLGEEQGFVGSVGQKKESLIINETLDDSRWIKVSESIRSAMYIPVTFENQIEGVFCFLCNKTGNFNEDISRDILTLANNLAIAIERTEFFKKINKSETRYRTIVENSADAIVSMDNNRIITAWSKGAEEIFGYIKDELVGKTINILVPFQKRKEIGDLLKEVAEKGFIRDVETQRLTKDGQLLDVDITITYLDTEQCYIEILRDITERKQAEDALRESKERFSNAFELAPIGMSLVDVNGKYLQVNHALCEITGYSTKELLQKTFQEVTHPDDLEADLAFFRQMLKGEIKTYEMEKRYIHKLGHVIWVLLSVSLVHDEKGTPLYFLSQILDISERKRSEELLKALNQAAVAMGTATSQKDIFNSIAGQLKQLNISCVLFPVDETQDRLYTKFMSFEPSLMSIAEKLVGIKHEDFSFPVNTIDYIKEIIHKKETLLIYGSEQSILMNKILPKGVKNISNKFVETLGFAKSISAPLIVEGRVIALFSVQSNTLTQEDIPAVTAFANQLASAWNKTRLVEDLRKTVEGTIQTLAITTEVRDPYTAGHQRRVSDLAYAIASEFQLSDEKMEGIKMAGLIHDIGKIQVPAEILSKPGKLNDIEFNLIKTHPKTGYDILKTIDFPWPIAQIVYQHHERLDGSGYPQGLKGEEIIIEARILAVADVVEAMSSHRPYRPALGIEKALEEISLKKGDWYDPGVVRACLKVFEKGFKFQQ